MSITLNRTYEHILWVSVNFGKVQSLPDIASSIGRNDIVGHIGDNGAGKCTMIKSLNGIILPSTKRLNIRTQPIDWDNFSVRRAHQISFAADYQEKSVGEKQMLGHNFFGGRQTTIGIGLIKIRKQHRIGHEILQVTPTLTALSVRASRVTLIRECRGIDCGGRLGKSHDFVRDFSRPSLTQHGRLPEISFRSEDGLNVTKMGSSTRGMRGLFAMRSLRAGRARSPSIAANHVLDYLVKM